MEWSSFAQRSLLCALKAFAYVSLSSFS